MLVVCMRQEAERAVLARMQQHRSSKLQAEPTLRSGTAATAAAASHAPACLDTTAQAILRAVPNIATAQVLPTAVAWPSH